MRGFIHLDLGEKYHFKRVQVDFFVVCYQSFIRVQHKMFPLASEIAS